MWQERLSGLAASDPTFAFLSSVAQGQDPSATKLTFTDWVDLAGLRRSVTRSKQTDHEAEPHLPHLPGIHRPLILGIWNR